MKKKLKSLLGIKEFWVEIAWDNGEKETVPVTAWGTMNAITKIKTTKDVVNKSEITVLNQSKLSRVRYLSIERSVGVAMKKDHTEYLEKGFIDK